MKRTLLISAALALTLLCSSASAQSIVPLFRTPVQHRHSITPRAPRPRKFVCVTGSLGDQLCCIWHVTYPGYGFGTWNDCIVVPGWGRVYRP